MGLARSLAILGLEESGKAVALHERRVQMAYEPEGTAFVDEHLQDLWASHQEKLKLVHNFLADEKYWFGTDPADPEENGAILGTIKRWTQRHDKLKQRGFYVDIDKAGNVLDPTGVDDRDSLARVIDHVHQIGWQIRLGEHIEAKSQAERAAGVPPASEAEIEQSKEMFTALEFDDDFFNAMRQGTKGDQLNNEAYRLHLPNPGSNPFQNLGKPGYEAETRELIRLRDELDERETP